MSIAPDVQDKARAKSGVPPLIMLMAAVAPNTTDAPTPILGFKMNFCNAMPMCSKYVIKIGK